jgi:uncharacterized phage-like protein YoqJ
MVYAVTGHRPAKVGGYSDESDERLLAFAIKTLGALPEYPKIEFSVLTGMAQGWDQAIARACVALHIPFDAAIPFPNFEALWPYKARQRYLDLLKKSRESHIVSQGVYTAEKMDKRNRWMVDRCDKLLALWDGSSGGTHNCVKYAKRHGVEVVNLWPQWEPYSDSAE